MKTTAYTTTSETSEMHKILRFLHSALLSGITVGNVGYLYRISYVPTARLRPRFNGAKT